MQATDSVNHLKEQLRKNSVLFAEAILDLNPIPLHDDQLWALALATYAAKEKETEPTIKIIKP